MGRVTGAYFGHIFGRKFFFSAVQRFVSNTYIHRSYERR